jgi:predicted nucleotidyltransferase
MRNTLKDISEKIEDHISRAIIQISEISSRNNIQFFIVWATARDLFFKAIYNISSPRATKDIDFGVRLRDWDEFETFKKELLKSIKIVQYGPFQHRFIYDNKTIIDIIPFGKIENPPGSIKWMPDEALIMSTIGFDEAFKSAEFFIISTNPQCKVKICTPPGLTIMKLISWNQRYPERNSDAKDLYFILSEYIHAGNEERIYSDELDNIKEQYPDFDYDNAGPYLLGKDVGAIADLKTSETIVSILNRETKDESNFNLIGEMIKDQFGDSDKFERVLKILKYFKIGIDDWMLKKVLYK